MLEIAESAIVLSLRPHGERDAIVSALTETQGRWAGLARGGAGRRQAPLWQPGNRIAARWKARLASHLGTWTAEVERAHAAAVLGEAGRLAALSSACAILDAEERGEHLAGVAFGAERDADRAARGGVVVRTERAQEQA
ncbi:MAG: recombination protein O N-terminal domain-containing protein, partial [Pseudomonadota bacterium]